MTLSDLRLTNPTAKVVHEAIGEAFRVVSERGIACISYSKISLKRISARAANEAEGFEFWASRENVVTGAAGQVVVAWWTAISGRRHVRVTGRLVTPETRYLINATKMNTRPPAWHVFPERIYRRRVEKENRLIAVCGCGAAGTEETIGWAGMCCGPCFDYQQEHGTLPWNRPALLSTPSPCVALAASADGRWVAGVCAGGVYLWDRDAGTEPQTVIAKQSNPELTPRVSMSANGKYLAVTGVIYDGLTVSERRENSIPIVRQFSGVEAATFRPSREGESTRSAPSLFDDLPDEAPSVQKAMYFLWAGRLMTASPPETAARELAFPRTEDNGPLVFSPDGTRFAVRRGEQIHIHELGSNTSSSIRIPSTLYHSHASVRMRLQLGAPHVAFSPDSGQVVIGYDRAIAVHHAVTGEQRFWDGNLPDEVSGVAFAPNGKWFFVGRRDGTLVAHRADMISNERSVVFRWTLGPIRGLAIAGDSLLTACDEGVQFWPMAKLLEGV